ITLGVKSPVLYNNRGKAYLTQENFPAAIKDLGMAISLDPKYTRAYDNRGHAYFKTNKFEEAAEDFRMVEKLTEKPEMDLYVMLAECYYNMKKYNAALE